MFINSQFFRPEVHVQHDWVLHSGSHQTEIKLLTGSEHMWGMGTLPGTSRLLQDSIPVAAGLRSLFSYWLAAGEALNF